MALVSPVRAHHIIASLIVACHTAPAAGIGDAAPPGGLPAAGWTQAAPGWKYEFPRDHGPHCDFKTEWWYFTGNLRDAKSNRTYGYELTFFRQGIRPAARAEAAPGHQSRFAVDDFKFAHFAISDLDGGKFH